MTRISSNLKFALRRHNITPPSSSKQASRSTPNGSQKRRTMLPMPSHVISIVQLVNSPKSSTRLCPSQLPKHFQIAPLPNKISLWLTALLLKPPVQEQLQEAHTRTTLGPGTVSLSTMEALESATTSSSTPLHKLNKTRSLEPSPWLSGKETFCQQLMTNWLWEQSKIPSQIFLQPSGKTGNPTQPRTMTSNLVSFYIANSEPTKMKTQKKNNKKQSLLASLPKLQRRISCHCNVPSTNSQLSP
jgi:hypothetical protein